ncbi:MAG: leucine-rich repeat domain-containing protein [Spirochaetaceae bacterium]|jgi:hypothetical protein|nr:leucine-rich repeat domain-containing protein [Spirochaetaceae bacterium]
MNRLLLGALCSSRRLPTIANRTYPQTALPTRGNFTPCVNLPRAEAIGDTAFANCGELLTVYIPSVRSIGKNVFAACWSVNTITLGASPPTLTNPTFSSAATGTITVSVPTDSSGYNSAWLNSFKYFADSLRFNLVFY